MWRWVRLFLLVAVGVGLLLVAAWLYDQLLVRDQDPLTGQPRRAAPRRVVALNPGTPPRLSPPPEGELEVRHGPPAVDLGEVPSSAAFGRPSVVLTCDVGALTQAPQGLYVTHGLVKNRSGLAPGAQPALVQGGELRVPALPGQDHAEVFFDDVGLVRMTWDETAAGDVTCHDAQVVAAPVAVSGEVRDGRGPLADVSVVGCGGVGRTDAQGRFALRAAGGHACTLHAVRFDGEAATWGPSITWTPNPAQYLVLEWARP